eukprot:TRINITY_DN12523_c0_g1_i1.p1 TRINITY_DN12523_c0_g1~~TRINITY_DN12523_c0_g1_i1.p1  ORF type:complete len:303 (+),score=35.94 TRINITY_DN12523_c0_g1_i1:50-958(+)
MDPPTFQEIKDLKVQFDKLYGVLNQKVEERVKYLEEKERCWNSLEEKLKANKEKGIKVTLNIGGTKFTTYKETLLCEKDTYFTAMLSSDNWLPDDDGEYFIDRDPQCFMVILNYLRTGKWDTRRLSEHDMDIFREDLEYYQIKNSPPGFRPWVFDATNSNKSIVLSDDRKLAWSVTDGTYQSILGTTGFRQGIHTWKAKVGEVAQWHAAGICKKEDAQKTGFTDDYKHWIGFSISDQKHRMEGRNSVYKGGEVFTFTLNFEKLSFTISGPLTSLQATITKDEYYPIFLVYNKKNSWELIEVG